MGNTEKIWKKNCPQCGGEQVYSCKYTLQEAILHNKRCNKCRWDKERIIIPTEGWVKICPKCKQKQTYSCKSILTLSIKRNRLCNKCNQTTRKINAPIDGYKRICPTCKSEIKYDTRKGYLLGNRINSDCIKCATNKSAKLKDISWMRSDNYRLKMSESIKKARKTDSYGEEFKQKCRLNKAKYVQMGVGSKPNYNKVACKFIDNINNKFGWELQHAENGGEKMISGFFVDGYDKNRNIVFEYDEPKHFTLSHEKRDRIKEKVIIKSIHPLRFIRYNERNSKMCDIITGKEI
jgi:hypothetical protein